MFRQTLHRERRRQDTVRRSDHDEPRSELTSPLFGSEQLTPTVQQSVLMTLSQRTMSLPVGAGMFRYRQTEGSDTDEIKIAAINTSARILPMASPVNLAKKEPRDPTSSAVPDRLEWPEFHTGVAAALQHNHGLDRLDNSKLNFNRPASLDARHAGLLFGLGLSGHLDTMSSSQAYEYLKAKHDPTSVGILLGLAVSYLGTGDPTVTSVIIPQGVILDAPGPVPLPGNWQLELKNDSDDPDTLRATFQHGSMPVGAFGRSVAVKVSFARVVGAGQLRLLHEEAWSSEVQPALVPHLFCSYGSYACPSSRSKLAAAGRWPTSEQESVQQYCCTITFLRDLQPGTARTHISPTADVLKAHCLASKFFPPQESCPYHRVADPVFFPFFFFTP